MANFVTGASAQIPPFLSAGSDLLALLLGIGDVLNNIDSRLKAYVALPALLQAPDEGLGELLNVLNDAVTDTLEETQASQPPLRAPFEAVNSKGGAA